MSCTTALQCMLGLRGARLVRWEWHQQGTVACAATVDNTETTLLSENPSKQKVVEIVKRIPTSIIKGGGTMVDAVCRTLCSNNLSDSDELLSFLPDYSQTKAFLLDISISGTTIR